MMLEDYKAYMAPLFPFVVVPPHMTSDQLRKERPFLWKGVIMQACHLDCARQIALGQELLSDIAQASLTKPQKSLDLLQGLEILIAWSVTMFPHSEIKLNVYILGITIICTVSS